MPNNLVLTLSDVIKPLEVQTNTSDFALGGVLLQEGYLITYESHKLSEAKRRYMA